MNTVDIKKIINECEFELRELGKERDAAIKNFTSRKLALESKISIFNNILIENDRTI